MKPSEIYFVAYEAAFKALPDASKALITKCDDQAELWRRAGRPSPQPAELVSLIDECEKDPFAAIAVNIRRLGNLTVHIEWKASEPAIRYK